MDLDTEKLATLATAFDAVSIQIFNDEYQAKIDEARAAKGYGPKKQPMISGEPGHVINEINATANNGSSL